MKIIAHRGASAYLPEHTLPCKALAFAMGADYLEQDVVATRDGELVVMHDIHIDRVTDVADRFPDRVRGDGRFYAIDFDFEELLSLNVHERQDAAGSRVYPGRYPAGGGRFSIHSLAEELQFVNGLNQASGRRVGVYPEIKHPAFHRREGFDITERFLGVLGQHGYSKHEDPVYVQCFDAKEVVRLRQEFSCEMKIVQLIGENSWEESETDYDWLKSEEGIGAMSEHVDGFGPWINQLFEVDGRSQVRSSGFAEMIHAQHREVHPYTLRADDIPAPFRHFRDLVDFLRSRIDVEAVFTDFPDRLKSALNP